MWENLPDNVAEKLFEIVEKGLFIRVCKSWEKMGELRNSFRPKNVIRDPRVLYLWKKFYKPYSILRLDLSGCRDITAHTLSHLLNGLVNLTYLDLTQTQITNQVLKNLGDFQKLTHLNLSGTKITDLNILAGLSQLTYLNLSDCKITDDDLAHLEGLVELTYLNLSDCKITDDDLAHLEGLVKLTYLNLSWCNINDNALVHIGKIVSLTSLDLEYCDNIITDTGHAHLQGLTRLTTLNLVKNYGGLRRSGLTVLRGLPKLSVLGITLDTLINDDELELLNGLECVTTLDMGACKKVTAAGLAHLRGLTGLTSLYMYNIGHITYDYLSILTCLENLTFVHLVGNNISGDALSSLRGHSQLTRLDMSDCVLTDAALGSLRGHSQLTHLDMPDCEFTDNGLAHLGQLKALTYLDLSGCIGITDASLAHLEGLTRLTSLDVRGCNLTSLDPLAKLGRVDDIDY